MPGPLASAIALCQHPDPFTARFTIRFGLLDDEHVRLAIFDIRGRRVRTLLDEHLVRGGHQAVWDGRDELGAPVPPGGCLSRLEAGHGVQTAKVALIR